MSFRLFIYYCSLCGGCAAYVGWALGRVPGIENRVAEAGVRGMFLGMMVGMSLGLIDALWNTPPGRIFQLLLRVVLTVAVGFVGGLLGGMIGQIFYGLFQAYRVAPLFLILGWALTGLLIGAAPGVFDLLDRVVRSEELRGALRKLVNGLLGGTVGGVLGGLLFLLLRTGWGLIFHDLADVFWSPGATGFVALGMCIGLLIGLAQVILKEAWIKVEQGFRAGRELILSKPAITIGRGEGCDIGLFGDAAVQKQHARIVRKGDRYLLDDLGSPSGTYLNGARIAGPTPLRSGDLIRLGKCQLRFGERQKRPTDN